MTSETCPPSGSAACTCVRPSSAADSTGLRASAAASRAAAAALRRREAASSASFAAASSSSASRSCFASCASEKSSWPDSDPIEECVSEAPDGGLEALPGLRDGSSDCSMSVGFGLKAEGRSRSTALDASPESVVSSGLLSCSAMDLAISADRVASAAALSRASAVSTARAAASSMSSANAILPSSSSRSSLGS
ncbi:uncharacterized protein LOC113147322 [Cyclospora cayetanensis]|uniref:Uncharacterized protein LOC113147322 n=1 Tax=Cyclospora cayetanensis TaxID=88456 RepID=A0A6P6RZC2_9EIME|nr:uncharacterized protein LOC113147322 [Cyclospora cayetanensis]